MDELNTAGNAQQVQPDKPARSGVGSIVGAIIIIILLAVGALYFWGAKLNERNDSPLPLILGNETTESNLSSDAAAGLPPLQESDDAATINADIQAMDIGALNAQTASSFEAYQAVTQ